MQEVTLSNDLKQIEFEIKQYEKQTGENLLEIGRRINWVKQNNLDHGEFLPFLERINISKSYAEMFMKVAKDHEIGNSQPDGNLGITVLYELTKIPNEMRNEPQQLDSGETKKPVDMTRREIQELNRKLRMAQEENADKDLQIERLNNRPEPKAKVIEKEVEIEKIPDDYHYFKGNFESIKAVNERLQNENKQIREELKSHSNEPNIDNSELLAKKEKLEAEISTLKNVAGLGEEINDFINRVSSYEYQIDMKQLVSKRDVLKSIYEAIGGLKKWCSDFEKELPTQNFIEGEMNHE